MRLKNPLDIIRSRKPVSSKDIERGSSMLTDSVQEALKESIGTQSATSAPMILLCGDSVGDKYATTDIRMNSFNDPETYLKLIGMVSRKESDRHIGPTRFISFIALSDVAVGDDFGQKKRGRKKKDAKIEEISAVTIVTQAKDGRTCISMVPFGRDYLSGNITEVYEPKKYPVDKHPADLAEASKILDNFWSGYDLAGRLTQDEIDKMLEDTGSKYQSRKNY